MNQKTPIFKGKNNAVLLRRRDEKSQDTKAPSGRGRIPVLQKLWQSPLDVGWP